MSLFSQDPHRFWKRDSQCWCLPWRSLWVQLYIRDLIKLFLTICSQSPTSSPSLGGTSTSPGCQAATGRGFCTIDAFCPPSIGATMIVYICPSSGTAVATSSSSTGWLEMNRDPSYLLCMTSQPTRPILIQSTRQCVNFTLSFNHSFKESGHIIDEPYSSPVPFCLCSDL